MSAVSALVDGIATALSWPNIGWILVGTLVGIVVGAIPGIGSAVGMALLLPLTLGMDPVSAIIVLVGIYSGSKYGGAISAILINTPGSESAAATTLDGYPMARKGLAKNALAASATASSLNGFLAAVLLVVLSPVLITVVLSFGSPEYFLLAFFGISLITVIARGSIVKGLIAGAVGFMLSSVGASVMTATPRFTFDYLFLYDGVDFVTVLIGLFAFAEMMKLARERTVEQGGSDESDGQGKPGSALDGFKSVFRHPVTTIKGGLIGMGVGMLPGAGSSSATFVAYAEEARSGGGDGSFGDGDIRGVISPESANNSSVCGAIVPTLTFGIPGGSSTAVLLGGLLMHGIRPGPSLFGGEMLSFTYALFVALFLTNLVILAFGLTLIPWFDVLTKVDANMIVPVIVVFAFTGAFGLSRSWFDVALVVAMGVVGYYMIRHNYSIIALVLGVVLGPVAERNLFRSLDISGGDFAIFVTRPLSLLLVIAILAVLFGPLVKPRFERLLGRART